MLNFFRGIFGPSNPNDETPKNFNSREDFLKKDDDAFSGDFFDNHDDHMGFNVFTSPLEMHRYFESQLKGMLRSFGIPGDDGSLFGFNESGPDIFSNFQDAPEQLPPSGDLRDQFLKPGYQQPRSRIEDRSDTDIDGKIKSADLDSIFSGKGQELEPYKETPGRFPIGRQIITKSFMNHNGIIQSEETVKDHEGNVKTIVTHKRGNQEYKKITTTNRNGEQEVTEKFINISENDLDKFFGGQNLIGGSPNNQGDNNPNWFPFDKFFK
ncbi:hypothetical protein Trydic_g236 [Trypoxylus dichotomus]